MKRIKKIRNMLSTRLFILIVFAMMLGFVFYGYSNIRMHRKHLMETVFLSTNSASDIIKRSTRYGMLLNRKEDVYQIINTIANEPGVEEIRIFNKKGEIIYSSDQTLVGKTVEMRTEACYICHSESTPLEKLAIPDRRRIYRHPSGYRIVGLINPIENEPECYNAACHAHEASQKILGVLDVKMSLAGVDHGLIESQTQMILFGLIMIIGTAIVSWSFIYYNVRRPIKKVIAGTENIASGILDHRIEINSRDELGQLARSFNKMSQDLQAAQQEITEWSNSLERKVEQKTKELAEARGHLERMERLVSLGKLSATVAHEINNPLAGVLNYTYLCLRILKKDGFSEELKANLTEYLNFIKNEITRSGNIVKNMLLFAKQTGGDFTKEHLHDLTDSGVMLVQHHMRLKNIQVEKKYHCDQDQLYCDAGQIRQALVAIFVNAIEAMDQEGKLTVATECNGAEKISIIIQDSGCGIPPEIVPKIFDPFFSTKKAGKGVGLGLSVVYGIIQRHKGDIRIDSKINQGTTFYIDLARHPVLDTDVRITREIIEEI